MLITLVLSGIFLAGLYVHYNLYIILLPVCIHSITCSCSSQCLRYTCSPICFRCPDVCVNSNSAALSQTVWTSAFLSWPCSAPWSREYSLHQQASILLYYHTGALTLVCTCYTCMYTIESGAEVPVHIFEKRAFSRHK